MTSTQGLIRDDEGVMRCWWAGSDPLFLRYHDEEWGRPIMDDSRLFEKIYAFMEAVGLVNDHIDGCVSRAAVETARSRVVRPVKSAREG